jgi:hypothetical protein
VLWAKRKESSSFDGHHGRHQSYANYGDSSESDQPLNVTPCLRQNSPPRLKPGRIGWSKPLIYYIIPFLIWATLCIWKALHAHKELKLLDYVFALPLILLAVLRGEVGTDTVNYIANAQYIIWWKDQGRTEFEFGYIFLVRLLATLTSDPRVVVALISLLAAIAFFAMLYMWENGQCIVSLVFIPFCFYAFTMNTLRMGIAFPLAAIAVLQLKNKHFIRFYILAFAAISIQMTAVILLPMLLLARGQLKVTWKGVLYGFFIGTAILYPAYYLLGDQMAYRILIYSAGDGTPTSSSGFGPLLLSLVCSVVALWFSERPHRYLGLIFLVIQVAFFGITQFSYAGLRFQGMALFAQLLALSYGAKRPIKRGQLAIVLLLCCSAFYLLARNIASGAGDVSAFIPYHFVWESQ